MSIFRIDTKWEENQSSYVKDSKVLFFCMKIHTILYRIFGYFQ